MSDRLAMIRAEAGTTGDMAYVLRLFDTLKEVNAGLAAERDEARVAASILQKLADADGFDVNDAGLWCFDGNNWNLTQLDANERAYLAASDGIAP